MLPRLFSPHFEETGKTGLENQGGKSGINREEKGERHKKRIQVSEHLPCLGSRARRGGCQDMSKSREKLVIPIDSPAGSTRWIKMLVLSFRKMAML